jgi:hypothetical protein
MALEMKDACDRCGKTLTPSDEARICSYECTFCPACAEEMKNRCPNCGEEVVPRPKRVETGG